MTANTKIYAPHKPQTMKNLNDLTANDAIRVDSAEQWNQLAPMLDGSKWESFPDKTFIDYKFEGSFYLCGFHGEGVMAYGAIPGTFNIIPASEFIAHTNLTATEHDYRNFMIEDMRSTFERCIQIAISKNNDYAGEATTDPFLNFRNSAMVGVSVERGILVRMMDKMTRVSNLLSQEAKVKDEAISDTLHDVINYAAILESYLKRDGEGV